MKEFLPYLLLSVVLAVVISSATTYFLTFMSLQQSIPKAVVVQQDDSSTDQPESNPAIQPKESSLITGETTVVELKCLEPCDDGNACTDDYCNETTGFKCRRTTLKGEVEGCKGMVEGSCYKHSCISGSCTLVYSSVCCGNGKCDSDEDYSLCPGDCQQASVQEQATTQQTSSLALSISIAKNPIVRGNDQTITIKVTDGSSAVEGASVSSTVTYASGTTQKDFSRTTNSNGEYSYMWKIGGSSTPGTFQVTATASKTGYDSGSASASFQVTTASG